METRVLFCRIGWLKDYAALDSNIKGAGAGTNIGHDWESFNFAPHNGLVYGYVAAPGNRTINVSRLGGSGDSVSNVLVVWLSPDPENTGQCIIGWYRNATVYRNLQPPLHGRNCYGSNGELVMYNIQAMAKDAILLAEHERRQMSRIPRKRGYMGQSNVGFMESAEEFVDKIVSEINAYQAAKPTRIRAPGPPPRPIVAQRRVDSIRRIEVEQAAMKIAVARFQDEGWTVKDVSIEKKGWDLEARKGNVCLRVEVKGCGGTFQSVELTPNEFAKMTNDELGVFRVCVVEHAISAQPRFFVFKSDADGNWRSGSELGSAPALLEIEVRPGARLRPVH